MSKNQECLEKILERLTGLIMITECDIKELNKLVNMALCTSAQLNDVENLHAFLEAQYCEEIDPRFYVED